jgi:hypothetical protein
LRLSGSRGNAGRVIVGRKPEPIIEDGYVDLTNEVIHVNGHRLTEELAEAIADEIAGRHSPS